MSPKLRMIAPCSANWEGMIGDDRSRYCEHCNLQVHNFSAMSASEVEQLLREHDGRICGRGFQEEDGSVAMGARPRLMTRLLVSALSAAISIGVAPAQTIPHDQVRQSQQEADASVTITVTDVTGAVVPKAQVTLRSLDGKFITRGVTDQSGVWRAKGFVSGTYNLRVNAVGFAENESELTLASDTGLVKILHLQIHTPEVPMGVCVQQEPISEVQPSSSAERSLVQIQPLPLLRPPEQRKHRR